MASVKIPSNQILFKYTIGGEYIYQDSYKEYQGYYYELNDKIFAGKEFNTNSPLLIKKTSDTINSLLISPKTFMYGKLSKLDIPSNNEIKSIPINTSIEGIKYFAKKLNSNPIRIIFISEEDYNKNINKNRLYSFTNINYNPEWGFTITDQNRKDIPEIDIFLKEYSQNPE
jgi:hypothetical protein